MGVVCGGDGDVSIIPEMGELEVGEGRVETEMMLIPAYIVHIIVSVYMYILQITRDFTFAHLKHAFHMQQHSLVLTHMYMTRVAYQA